MSDPNTILIAWLVKATLLLALALAAHAALRRASAATRHLSLTMAMLGLAALPLLSLGLPVWDLEVLPPTPSVESKSPAAHPVALDDKWQEAGGESNALHASADSVAAVAPPSAPAIALPEIGLAGWLLVVWSLGACFVLSRLAAGLLRMRWIARHGERVTEPGVMRLLDDCVNTLGLGVRPLLIASDRAGVPLVWGCLRPSLIVPRSFPEWGTARMRAVILHELGHLQRNDWAVLLLGRIVAALYWFHPLAWIVERCAKQECERACDDIVVTHGPKPSEYASHLLSIARGVSETPASVRAALAVVRRSQLNSRLRSILNPVLRRNTPSRTAVTGLGTVLLMVLVPLASLQFSERAYANDPQEVYEVREAQYQKQRQEMHAEHDAESSEGKRAYETGYKHHGNGQYDEAIAAFEEARDLGFQPGASIYNIACCHALQGDAGQAMSMLDRAFDAGFDDPENLVQDSDFDRIRRDDAFQAYIDRAFEKAEIERSFPEHYPYRATLEMFDELKETGSTNGKKWHHVGYKLIGLGEYDRAIIAFEAAVEHMGENNAIAMYNLGCIHALSGNSPQALSSLDDAVEAGFEQHERFLNDPDLESLRSSSEFDRIKKKSEFLSLGRFPQRSWEDSDYSEERWAPAVSEYQDYVAKNPSSGRAWFSLGYALHFSGRHDEAVGAFEKAAAQGFRVSTSTYNVACANAMANRTGAALDALESAVEAGNLHYGQLESDSDLDSLRDEPRFQQMLDTLEKEQEAHEAEWDKMKDKQLKFMKEAFKVREKNHDHDD